MNARITKAGNLEIERAGKWKEARCPYSDSYMEIGERMGASCGDWCALFGEHEDTVIIACSPLGPVHTITSDAREKPNG